MGVLGVLQCHTRMSRCPKCGQYGPAYSTVRISTAEMESYFHFLGVCRETESASLRSMYPSLHPSSHASLQHLCSSLLSVACFCEDPNTSSAGSSQIPAQRHMATDTIDRFCYCQYRTNMVRGWKLMVQIELNDQEIINGSDCKHGLGGIPAFY